MSNNHHNQAKRLSIASLTVPMRGPRRMSNVSYTPISGERGWRERETFLIIFTICHCSQ